MSEERKVYDLNGHTVEEVKENIEGYLGTIRKMEVQSGPSGDGYIIQARSREGWKKFFLRKKIIKMKVVIYKINI